MPMPKKPRKNVFFVAKRRHGQVTSIAAINVSKNFSTNLILKNGRTVKLKD